MENVNVNFKIQQWHAVTTTKQLFSNNKICILLEQFANDAIFFTFIKNIICLKICLYTIKVIERL